MLASGLAHISEARPGLEPCDPSLKKAFRARQRRAWILNCAAPRLLPIGNQRLRGIACLEVATKFAVHAIESHVRPLACEIFTFLPLGFYIAST
jgi:hypothetical protein